MEHCLDKPLRIVQNAGLAPLHADAARSPIPGSPRRSPAFTRCRTRVQLVLIDDDYMSDLKYHLPQQGGHDGRLVFRLRNHTWSRQQRRSIHFSAPSTAASGRTQRPSLEELARLLVHGLLHLAGWVHDTPEATSRYGKRETDHLLTTASLSL